MNRARIKKLAHMALEDPKIDERIQQFVLARLKRAKLKLYLFYMKQELSARRVKISTANELGAAEKEGIQSLFPDKRISIEYSSDPFIGAGMIIERKDTVVDLSVRSMINKTIQRLKEGL